MPICDCCQQEVTHTDKHHLTSKSLGGTNDKHNIANICPNCHRKVHGGMVILEGWFLTSNGFQLIWHNNTDDSITNNKPECYIMGEHK